VAWKRRIGIVVICPDQVLTTAFLRWIELADEFDKVDREPCYHGGRSVYVRNIFKDPVI